MMAASNSVLQKDVPEMAQRAFDAPDAPAREFDSNSLASSDQARILVIACGALARDILLLRDLNQWDHLDLTCLPATLHNRPAEIPAAVQRKIARARATYDKIFVAYADCGTGGALDHVIKEEGVERIEGAHCYAFFAGIEDFDAIAEQELGSFYLTDFLARHFDTLVWKGLGLDRHPELLSMYFGNYTRLVYLAQTNDERLNQLAMQAAERLGLTFERVQTGFGLLENALSDFSQNTLPKSSVGH